MKKYNILAIFLMSLVALLSSCHSPDDLKPAASRIGINSITAKFTNSDGTFSGAFKGFAKEGSDEIIIEIPYFFPENSDNQVTPEMLKKMRVNAELAENATISPAILFMDMNQDNVITVKDQVGEKKNYTIRAQVTKSKEATLVEFKLPALDLSAVIKEDTKEIVFATFDELGLLMGDVKLSPHATIYPDPQSKELDYSKELSFTVTAFDGVTKNIYTTKIIEPSKLEVGLRVGSEKLLFAKKLGEDFGLKSANMTIGLAAIGDYVVLNTRGEKSVYLDAITGEKVGAINLGSITGSLTNFYNTADAAGNILINNLANNAGTFKIWKLSSITGTPELFIDWTSSGATKIGRKVSINGSVDGNAIITAGIHDDKQSFARWTVVDGVLTSHNPEIVKIQEKLWSDNHVDIIYTSHTDVKSDYFVIGSNVNKLTRVNGQTNSVIGGLSAFNASFLTNALDFINFNNAQYVVCNYINGGTTSAEADQVWLFDAQKLSGTAASSALWSSEANKYGPTAIGEAVNGNGTGDVAFRVSEDGLYLYVYFLFTNGYVVGYQFDCFNM